MAVGFKPVSPDDDSKEKNQFSDIRVETTSSFSFSNMLKETRTWWRGKTTSMEESLLEGRKSFGESC